MAAIDDARDQQIAELTAQIDVLTARLDALGEVPAGQGSRRGRRRAGPDVDARPSAPLSRRGLVKLGGAAAAGVGIAAVSSALRPVAANATTGSMQFGSTNNAGTSYTDLSSTNQFYTLGVYTGSSGGAAIDAACGAGAVAVRAWNRSSSSYLGVGAAAVQAISEGPARGVHATSLNGTGVYGVSTHYLGTGADYTAGVVGESKELSGVVGVSLQDLGVHGITTSGKAGVYGETASGEAGVHGKTQSAGGVGVFGDGVYNAIGVYGHSGNSHGVQGVANEGVGVYGLALNPGGIGVQGIGASSHGVHGLVGSPATAPSSYAQAAVFGQAAGGLAALRGVAASGAGLNAVSTAGYGAALTGGRAPLRLVPASTAGAPASGSHLLGELYVDKNGVLYLCTVAGAPGTWKRVSLS